MTKVIKGEFENLGFLEINDDLFACNTQVGTLCDEFNRLSIIDNDLFTYETEVPKPSRCDKQTSNPTHNDLEEYKRKISYDECEKIYAEVVIFINKRLVKLIDTKNALWVYWARGDDEVELSDEESSDTDNENLIDKDDVVEIFRIDTNVFDFETPTCRAFKEFNYLLQIDPDVLTKDIDGFKTYEEYKDDWIYEWNEEIPWWTFLSGQLVVGKMMDIAKFKKRWKTCLEHLKLGTHSDIKIWSERENEEEHENEERCELFDNPRQETPVCKIRRFEMIKYSFGQDEEYVAIKECEYDDLTKTNEDACRAYQEIFRSMDEGWVVIRAELRI
ncbi:VIER F-box protein 2 [Tanacetum coccineum]|uniref:VIER F-box protein 2 n=1 Tax=Tanacetum coccineum TaxID=301880 RepID=A0ABQ5B9U0_9ASTR